MSDCRLEIQKRHTLNWLIQGAAQHAGMTFHHLVRNELNALDPRLLRYYDQYALINLLQYWQPTCGLIFGWPPRFWRQAASKRRHPFFRHPLLSKYGGMLVEAGRQRALARCKEKGLTRLLCRQLPARDYFRLNCGQVGERGVIRKITHALRPAGACARPMCFARGGRLLRLAEKSDFYLRR